MSHSNKQHSTIYWRKVLVGVFCLIIMWIISASAQDSPNLKSQKIVAEYVKNKILEGDFGNRTLWMTATPLDKSYVARNLIRDKNPDIPFPYSQTWLVMIDDNPDANFAHPVRWVFVKGDLKEHTEPIVRDFPPLILSDHGKGKAVKIGCVGVTPRACPDSLKVIPKEGLRIPIKKENNCLNAVLVSGGINSGMNYNRYRQNLRSMYQILTGAGYKKSNVYVYYADGSSLDLDNADGDNNDATGNDVTAGADESLIRARIQQLCKNLNPKKDILFLYFSNHGADNDGVCLWDGNNNGLDANELYSPAELAADVANSKVCRLFMIHDQCYSGDFLPMASDGNHKNLVVYVAASATEVSWGRQYMAQWEQNNFSNTTMNNMHQDVVNNGNLTSTPGMAEGTPNLGNVSGNICCKLKVWPCWIWIIIIIVVIIIILIIFYFIRKKKK